MKAKVGSKFQPGKIAKYAKSVFGNWQLYLMLLPALLYIILFCYRPMYGMQIAFRDFTFKGGITGSEWVGFDNFRRLFNSYWFPIILKNTLTLSALSLILSFPLPIIFALMVNEIRNEKIKRTLQTVSYAPHFISTVVMCGMLILLLNPDSGIINILIKAFGGTPVRFIGEPELYKWVYVLSGIWQTTGWSSIIYLATISGIDQSQYEAAEIDGASRWQRLVYITLPSLLPTISIMFILEIGGMMGGHFDQIYNLQNDIVASEAETLALYIYRITFERKPDYGFSTAVSMFCSVINAALMIAANTVSKRLGGGGLIGDVNNGH